MAVRLDVDLDRIRELAKDGWSCVQISREMCLSKQTVKRRCDQFEIPLKRGYHGSPMEKNGSWRGGRKIDKSGYVLVREPSHPAARSGYVREHRLVMERVLGRTLLPTEVVHHRDGNPQNNAAENLELFARNSDHLRHELTGKVPKWTEDGKRRIRLGVLRAVRTRAAKKQRRLDELKNGAQPSP